MSTTAFGLDIGDINIRAVELKSDGKSLSLSASITVPAPIKGMLSEAPLDQEDIAKIIKKLVRDAGISNRHVNIALPENQVYTKVVEMPYLSDRELASAIYWEAEQYIPIPLENISLAWNVIKRSEKPKQGEKMNVLMVGAPTLIVQKYQKVLQLAGLSIENMETEILAIIRSVTFLMPPNNLTPIIIVNIGTVNTSLAIVLGKDLVFIYSMQIGGAAINRAISADFGLSGKQAEEYKKAYGVTNTKIGNKISGAVEPIMSSILIEVKKAIVYFSQKYQNTKIEQLVLSGSTARIPGIDSYFANGLGIEAAVGNPWRILGNQNIPKEIINSGPEYGVAVGLALKDYEQ